MTTQSGTPIQWRFALKWVAANALGLTCGQIGGLFAGFAVGGFLVPVAGQAAGALAAFAAHGAVTGASIGLMQRIYLRQEIDLTRQWILASSLGWAIGSLAATWIASMAGAALDELSGALSWALIGASVGSMQWLILRQQVHQAAGWVLANIVGWLMAPPVAALGGVVIGPLVANLGNTAVLIMASALTGAAAGVFTGTALVWLLRHPVKQA